MSVDRRDHTMNNANDSYFVTACQVGMSRTDSDIVPDGVGGLSRRPEKERQNRAWIRSHPVARNRPVLLVCVHLARQNGDAAPSGFESCLQPARNPKLCLLENVMRFASSLLVFVFLLCVGSAAMATDARLEAWQLSYGGFVTASDVRNHNALPQDRADLLASLQATPPGYRDALEIYTFGKHFPWRRHTHSLGRFADDYNGTMLLVVPLSVTHWGNPSFQVGPVYSALAGTAGFQGAEDDLRVAMIDGGTLATIVNWTRFELAMSERKALASEPNWSLQNGSPKNWNEIFAFHWGPSGLHSVHEALESVSGGGEVNAALYRTLAEGQVHLLEQRWAPDEAATVSALLDQGSLRLLHAALIDLESAPSDGARARAAVYARGLWLAAAEPILKFAPEAVDSIKSTLAGSGDPDSVPFALEIVEKVLAQL